MIRARSSRFLQRSNAALRRLIPAVCGLVLLVAAGEHRVLLAASTSSDEQQVDSVDRIQGGRVVEAGELDAVGTIPGCTATLINQNTVLTAAHCVCSSGNGGNPSANTCNARRTFTLRQVRRPGQPDWVRQDVNLPGTVYVHPDYERRSWLSDDLAIIKLDELSWVRVRGVKAIPILPGVVPREGRSATISGFGLTGAGCKTANSQKRLLTLPIDTVSAGSLVFRANNQHACPGDSGGPMLYAPDGMLQVIGTASWINYVSDSTYRPVFSSWRWLSRFVTERDLRIIAMFASTSGTYRARLWSLKEDAPVFTDRNFRFTHVPEQLEGAHYIQTPNTDKFVEGNNVLSWKSNKPAVVYVGHDDRYSALPSWMSSFTNSGMNVEFSTGSSTVRMSLYRREFPAGRIKIGGNHPTGTSANFANYVVIVDDQDLQIPRIWAGSDKVYDPVPSGLHDGALVYSDREQTTFVDVPSMLHGATYVRGAADDKFVEGNLHLYFYLTRPATVYVAYDPRYAARPPWLGDWVDTGQRLGQTGPGGDVTMAIYGKSLDEGLHLLGGNKPPGDDSNYAPYVVVLEKAALP